MASWRSLSQPIIDFHLSYPGSISISHLPLLFFFPFILYQTPIALLQSTISFLHSSISFSPSDHTLQISANMVRAILESHAIFQALTDSSGRINYHLQHGECEFEALSASIRICPLLTWILAYEVHGSRTKGLQHGRVHLDRRPEWCSLQNQGTCSAHYPHVQPQCRLPSIFDAGDEAPEALLSAQRVTPLGLASSSISPLNGSPTAANVSYCC